MASPTEQAVRDILRETGRPMTAAEIGAEVAQRLPVKTANPANTVRNVMSYNRTCVNAGRGLYAYLPSAVNGAAVRSGALDDAAVAAANEAARTAAADALRGGDRGTDFSFFVGRLLARRVYHRAEPPDPLVGVLLLPSPRFVLSRGDRIEYHPDLSSALVDLFQDRLLSGWQSAEIYVRIALKLPEDVPPDSLADLGERAPAIPFPPPPLEAAEVVQAVQMKVALDWMPEVWRRIEIREDQTFAELHREIQRAFGWDDDHLYSFYLSGRYRDSLTEIERSSYFGGPIDTFGLFSGYPPVYSGEVAIADVDPKPKQKLLYLFDYGDMLRHRIAIEALTPADGDAYPRIVETHGEAPPQYPMIDEEWDEEWDEDEEVDGDDEVGLAEDDFEDVEGEWVVDPTLPPAPYPIGEPFPLDDAFGRPAVAVEDGTPDFGALFDLVVGVERPDYNQLLREIRPEPDPALRSQPLDLNELVPALALSRSRPVYLDLESGTLLVVPAGEAADAQARRAMVAAAPDRYLALPEEDLAPTAAERIAFAERVEAPAPRARLLAAAQSRAPAVRFDRELARDDALAERWNEHLHRRWLARAIAWLESLGVAPTAPTSTGKKGAAEKHKAPSSKRAAKRRKR